MKKTFLNLLRALLPSFVKRKLFHLGFNLDPEEFRRFSYEYAFAPDMSLGLEKLSTRGLAPKTIVDVGGFEGKWSELVNKIWPDAKISIFEANEEKKGILEKVARKIGATVHISLLGSKSGEVLTFHVMESGSSVLEEDSPLGRKKISVATTTLDDQLKSADVDLLKLDVQGFELEVLKGGRDVLRRTTAVILEISLIEINKGAPSFADVISFMDNNGFAPVDFLEIHRRPLDQATNQVDRIFARKDSHFFSDTRHF